MHGGAVLELAVESRGRRQCGAGAEKAGTLILRCLEPYKGEGLQGEGQLEIRV